MRRILMLSAMVGILCNPARAADETPANTAAQTSPSPLPPNEATQWLRRPNGGDIARVYPRRALQEGVSGPMTIRCRIDTSGGLADCAIIFESPPGYGFGNAALALAPLFEMPQSAGGRPTAGPSVTVPMRFLAPPYAARAPRLRHRPHSGPAPARLDPLHPPNSPPAPPPPAVGREGVGAPRLAPRPPRERRPPADEPPPAALRPPPQQVVGPAPPRPPRRRRQRRPLFKDSGR